MRLGSSEIMLYHFMISFPMNMMKVILPPASAVIVTESVLSACPSVCMCVCQCSHDRTLRPMDPIFGTEMYLDYFLDEFDGQSHGSKFKVIWSVCVDPSWQKDFGAKEHYNMDRGRCVNVFMLQKDCYC